MLTNFIFRKTDYGKRNFIRYYFERFLREYEDRFEKEYGYFRPVIQEVVERYLDCGNPMCGFMKRFFFDETGGKVRYQYDKHGSKKKSMDYLEFIARVTSHTYVPSKGWAEMIPVRYMRWIH